MLEPLDPPEWPGVWQSLDTSDAGTGKIIQKNGARTTVAKNGDRTYRCYCGSTFTRAYGFKNEEAREWVKFHTPHLPAEERADVSP